jgi:1-deoxy-D-xylulose-5-phosphate synthase
VAFCIDRAGLVGDDGAVHHGFCDLSFLRAMPGIVLVAPSDERDMIGALDFATTLDAPSVMRYPRDNCPPAPLGEQVPWAITKSGGKSRTLKTGADATIIAYGSLAWQSLEAAQLLDNEGLSVAVIDARFCKPLDSDMLQRVFTAAAAAGSPILTVEDHSIVNGFGTAVVEHAAEKRYDARRVTRLGLPDRFIKHAKRSEQLKDIGLDAAGIARAVRAAIEESRQEPETPAVIGTMPVRRNVRSLR